MLRKNLFAMKRFFYFFMLTGSALFFFSNCSPDVDDNTAPTIVFGGGNPMYVSLHTPYKDSLVYFSDNSGIAKVWNDTTEYNPEHIGRYSVKYYAEDSYGNVSSATRVFVVRIEGTTLSGRWDGTRTEPWPGGTAVDYTDSLVSPASQAVYLSAFVPGTTVRIEMKNATGDTLYLPSQVVAFNDTSQTLVKGSGLVTGDGSAFTVDYSFITISTHLSDTIRGHLDFQVHAEASDTLQ